MTRTHVLRLNYVWWMVCGWMALSGLLVLVVQHIGKLSLPEGGYIMITRIINLFWYNGGF